MIKHRTGRNFLKSSPKEATRQSRDCYRNIYLLHNVENVKPERYILWNFSPGTTHQAQREYKGLRNIFWWWTGTRFEIHRIQLVKRKVHSRQKGELKQNHRKRNLTVCKCLQHLPGITLEKLISVDLNVPVCGLNIMSQGYCGLNEIIYVNGLAWYLKKTNILEHLNCSYHSKFFV